MKTFVFTHKYKALQERCGLIFTFEDCLLSSKIFFNHHYKAYISPNVKATRPVVEVQGERRRFVVGCGIRIIYFSTAGIIAAYRKDQDDAFMLPVERYFDDEWMHNQWWFKNNANLPIGKKLMQIRKVYKKWLDEQ